MGREPVAVNGAPVTSPLELATGDKIEVLLENRTRVFYFQGDDETVQIRAPPARPPLADANAALAAVPAAKPAAKGDDGPARRPAPPPASARSMAAVMQDAIKVGIRCGWAGRQGLDQAGEAVLFFAVLFFCRFLGALGCIRHHTNSGIIWGAPASPFSSMLLTLPPFFLFIHPQAGVQLKKVQVASTKPTPRAVTAGGMFVPTPADLLKLKAGLRKTAAGPAAAKLEEEAAAPVQAQGADDAAAAEAPAGPDAQLVDAEAMETEEAAAVVEEPNVPLAADLAAAEPATEAVEATAGAGRPEAAPVAAEEAQAAVEEPATEQPAVAAAEPAAAPPEVGGDAAMPDTAAPQAAETAAAEEPLAAVDDAAAAASEAAGVPGSVMRKRKSVRFHVEETAQQRVAGTPEGSARDATITIRLRKGDIEQARPGCRLAGAGRRWFQVQLVLARGCLPACFPPSPSATMLFLSPSLSVPLPANTTPANTPHFSSRILTPPALAHRSSTLTTTRWRWRSGVWARWGSPWRSCPTQWCPSAAGTAPQRPSAPPRRPVSACSCSGGGGFLCSSQGREAGKPASGCTHRLADAAQEFTAPTLAGADILLSLLLLCLPAVRSMLQELLAGSPAVSCGAQATPGAMGPAAPAPTPASGAAQASHADGAGDLVLDPATLAAKLTEMAEQHDVTLEVPVVSVGQARCV